MSSVRCVVFDDRGAPLPGVAVSDGVAVVTTDADGTAELPDAEPPGHGRPFVWVSRPDGFDTDEWFRRTTTAPDTGLYPGADGGDPPTIHRFVLRRVEQSLPFTFAQITDLHLSALDEPARLPFEDGLYGLDEQGSVVGRPLTQVHHLADALAEVAVAEGPHGRPRFIVATGDLTDHGTSTEFAMLAQAVATSPVPVHPIPGNHDHYGHLHEPEHDDRPIDSQGMGTGTITRYDRHVGPRWWSLTWGGLRIVGLDWFSHRLRIDRDEQETWLAADLATAPAGTPVLFLTHDQMPSEFFDRVASASPHVRIVGSLSGHWHTSRVVCIDGQVHANTGNATFGSFDWAPAHARLFGWDGSQLTVRTTVLGADPSISSSTFAAGSGPPLTIDGAAWAVRLPGAVHLARPALVGDRTVVVAWSDDDRATGGLVSIDADTGEEHWRVEMDAPVRAGATWLPNVGSPAGLVIAVSVSGGVVAVDADSGAARWTAQLGDRMMAWVHAAPIALGGAVAVGEIRCFAVFDADTGEARWVREERSRAENMATTTQGVWQDDTLLVAYPMMEQHTVGLEVDTGEVRWSADGVPHHSWASDAVADPDGADVYVTRLGGRVERLAAATGEVRWTARVAAAFAPGRPLVVDDSLVVTTALGAVHRFDRRTGHERWRSHLPGSALVAMGPYRRTGLAVPAGPTLVGEHLVQPTGDGWVHRLDLASGQVIGATAIGAPITVPAVAVGSDVVVAVAEGTLARLTPA